MNDERTMNTGTSTSPGAESRVYDKEKVHKLVTEAEQMVSLCGDACRPKDRHQELRYGNSAGGGASSECDASSELTSEGECEIEHKDGKKPPSSGNFNLLCHSETRRRSITFTQDVASL